MASGSAERKEAHPSAAGQLGGRHPSKTSKLKHHPCAKAHANGPRSGTGMRFALLEARMALMHSDCQQVPV